MSTTKTAETLVVLGGVKYLLSQLLQQANLGPKIVVKTADLNPMVPGSQFPELAVTIEGNAPMRDPHPVVFYKQLGKMTVVLGRDQVQKLLGDGKAEISGKLLSGPAIKKAKLPDPAIERHNQEMANQDRFNDRHYSDGYGDRPRRYPDEFNNRPRFVNR